jgi:hypothetical protein
MEGRAKARAEGSVSGAVTEVARSQEPVASANPSVEAGEVFSSPGDRHRDESRRGTHECVRHISLKRLFADYQHGCADFVADAVDGVAEDQIL